MANVRLIIYKGQVLGYSENKNVINGFIHDYGIESYTIEKIKKIPEDIEYEFQEKELYYNHYCDLHVSEMILNEVYMIAENIATELSSVNAALHNMKLYFRLDEQEMKDIVTTQRYLADVVGDLVDADDHGGGAYHGDYFNIKELIKELINKNITVYGGER